MKPTPLLASFAAVAVSASAILTATPPSLIPLFTATIHLANPTPPLAVPIPGGIRSLEPITGGTITGALNSTIQAGIAYPALYEDKTIEIPSIMLYGTTDDKEPYLIQLSGVGKVTGQETRVQIEIGGKYSALADAFIIAQLKPQNAAHTIVIVDGYQVQE